MTTYNHLFGLMNAARYGAETTPRVTVTICPECNGIKFTAGGGLNLRRMEYIVGWDTYKLLVDPVRTLTDTIDCIRRTMLDG